MTEATLFVQAAGEPQTPPVRLTENTVAPTEYSSSASPFDFTSAASQVTAPDAVATVTAAAERRAVVGALAHLEGRPARVDEEEEHARAVGAEGDAGVSRRLEVRPRAEVAAGARVRHALVVDAAAGRPRSQERAVAGHRGRVVAVRLAAGVQPRERQPPDAADAVGDGRPSGTGRRSGSSAPRAEGREGFACDYRREHARDLKGADVTVGA